MSFTEPDHAKAAAARRNGFRVGEKYLQVVPYPRGQSFNPILGSSSDFGGVRRHRYQDHYSLDAREHHNIMCVLRERGVFDVACDTLHVLP